LFKNWRPLPDKYQYNIMLANDDVDDDDNCNCVGGDGNSTGKS